MIKTSIISVWSSDNGKYLFMGNCFEEELLKQFTEWKNYDHVKNHNWYIIISEHLKSDKSQHHKQDVLNEAFRLNVSLDVESAERLNLFDIISPECFTANNELGDAMIKLCEMSDMKFIVSMKRYCTREDIWLSFEVCHSDSEYDCHKALITQSI